MTIKEEEIRKDGLSLGFTDNAITVLQKRYLRRSEDGSYLENLTGLFKRVAKVAADVEKKYGASPEYINELEQKFLNLMLNRLFMPNSPTLMNAGREHGLLSACFVLPIGDSVNDIFDTVKATAMIQKAGGGTGFSLDRLRATGDWVSSSGGKTSGPIPFWRVLNESINAIQQAAHRRGAAMCMMSVTHPDILKFVNAKQDRREFLNFNISVKIPDEWMKTCLATPNYPLEVKNPKTGNVYLIPKKVDISTYQLDDLIKLDGNRITNGLLLKSDPVWTMGELYEIIVNNAWQTGEPGILFIDKVNKTNPTPNISEIEATNPCGEQPLLPFEACNLGSINLGAFITKSEINWDALRGVTQLSTHFLDNIVDANYYPLPEITKICTENRKIGLGIMGFADALFQLGIPYNSEDGLKCGENFMKFINDVAHEMSESLAEKRGVFSNWKGSRWDTEWKRKQRNAAVTTVAPTGTISIIANCSCGIEPLFALTFTRNVLEGKKLTEINEIFKKVAQKRGFYSDELLKKIAQQGTISGCKEIPKEVQHIFVCAHDIDSEWHIKMQAAFQKHCDSSISKTINLPHDAKSEDVKKIYQLAFDLNCKGVTVYRDGCRDNQPMSLANKIKISKDEILVHDAPKRPESIDAVAHIIKPNGKRYTVFVGLLKGRPFEVFVLDHAQAGVSDGMTGMIIKSKDGSKDEVSSDAVYNFESGCLLVRKLNRNEDNDISLVTRLISTALRHGTPLEFIVDQIGKSKVHISNCARAIARTLAIYIKKEEVEGKFKCNQCGSTDIKWGGSCFTCMSCGFSKCS